VITEPTSKAPNPPATRDPGLVATVAFFTVLFLGVVVGVGHAVLVISDAHRTTASQDVTGVAVSKQTIAATTTIASRQKTEYDGFDAVSKQFKTKKVDIPVLVVTGPCHQVTFSTSDGATSASCVSAEVFADIQIGKKFSTTAVQRDVLRTDCDDMLAGACDPYAGKVSG
jgi:hypothetical protein